jgi:hypothetical protein
LVVAGPKKAEIEPMPSWRSTSSQQSEFSQPSKRDEHGRIRWMLNRSSAEGIFAAGDVTDVPSEQVLISIGKAPKAALAAYEYRSSSHEGIGPGGQEHARRRDGSSGDGVRSVAKGRVEAERPGWSGKRSERRVSR